MTFCICEIKYKSYNTAKDKGDMSLATSRKLGCTVNLNAHNHLSIIHFVNNVKIR